MTHIEQVIKEAVSRGYTKYALPRTTGKYGKTLKDIRRSLSVEAAAFLDPSFWQALFKEYRTGLPFNIHLRTQPQWKQQWHRFIDHLADGKDAESFFASL